MRQKYRSQQTRARRRGFTLLELLIASTCTVAIATAGTTMTLAVANAVQSAPDNAAVVITGHGAVNRAAKYVRQSRLVGYYDATQAALWVGDKNNDDRTQLSETAVLWYDSASQEMRWSKPFSDSTSAATITASDRVVPLTELTTAAFLDTVRKSTYVGTAVLAGGATQLTISGNASTTGAELLDMRLQLTSSQGPLSFVTTASPRAMGDYLTSSTKYTNDGVATKRLRRTSLRLWAVPP